MEIFLSFFQKRKRKRLEKYDDLIGGGVKSDVLKCLGSVCRFECLVI